MPRKTDLPSRAVLIIDMKFGEGLTVTLLRLHIARNS